LHPAKRRTGNLRVLAALVRRGVTRVEDGSTKKGTLLRPGRDPASLASAEKKKRPVDDCHHLKEGNVWGPE